MTDINELKFDQNGLIPAVVVDAESGAVLTLAYMNMESLEISLREKTTCFWSRSRKELWRKGETSGNRQHIISITADCDMDALVISAVKDGPACHTGSDSCFFNTVFAESEFAEPVQEPFSIDRLYSLIEGRRDNPVDKSYTSYLFEKGTDKILKKIGEESTEVIVAGKGGDKAETVYEIADLAYHLLVLMADMGIKPTDIKNELASRHVVDSKVKQEKMR